MNEKIRKEIYSELKKNRVILKLSTGAEMDSIYLMFSDVTKIIAIDYNSNSLSDIPKCFKFLVPQLLAFHCEKVSKRTQVDFTENYLPLMLKVRYLSIGNFQQEVVITKENIHLYYEFMSDEDLEKHSGLIAVLIGKRDREIFKKLFNPSTSDWDDKFTIFCSYLLDRRSDDSTYKIEQTIFGVKDTLKPIDEYIEEIKGSSEYKAYALSGEQITKEKLLKILNSKVFSEHYNKFYINTKDDIEAFNVKRKGSHRALGFIRLDALNEENINNLVSILNSELN